MIDNDPAHPWLAWQGGECPLPAGTLVQVRFRYNPDVLGDVGRGRTTGRVEDLRWWHRRDSREATPGDGDILFYRTHPGGDA